MLDDIKSVYMTLILLKTMEFLKVENNKITNPDSRGVSQGLIMI